MEDRQKKPQDELRPKSFLISAIQGQRPLCVPISRGLPIPKLMGNPCDIFTTQRRAADNLGIDNKTTAVTRSLSKVWTGTDQKCHLGPTRVDERGARSRKCHACSM
jgi:hypothetical protein